ncbi:MAG: ankyrin repeat domain-containing protein [Proteobacteria bacterium]|nr:ankyrin repeat domain-containing protein [Pseudomonadota bacterium]
MFQGRLHTVAAAGNQNHALRLILAGAEVNQPNSRGSTPLHHAAVSNRFHMANTLANAGANVKTKNKDGLSAFGIFSIKYGKENARRIFADGNAPSFGQDKPTLKLGR